MFDLTTIQLRNEAAIEQALWNRPVNSHDVAKDILPFCRAHRIDPIQFLDELSKQSGPLFTMDIKRINCNGSK